MMSTTMTLPLSGSAKPSPVAEVAIWKAAGKRVCAQADVLAVEEPLEICLRSGPAGQRTRRTISVTMRSPGQDAELAAGFLWTEGIVTDPSQIIDIQPCGPVLASGSRNVVHVELRDIALDLARLERHFYTSSSCGVCGKTSIEAVCQVRRAIASTSEPHLDPTVVKQLPHKLRSAQTVFDRTGGLHAAALFDAEGRLGCLREDVGRHNAVDKVIGAELLAGRLPLSTAILLVSGRASFELVQKAMMAGIPVLAAVGAPSSLAVELARDCGLTILGFVREDRFNIYTGMDRIEGNGFKFEDPRPSNPLSVSAP